MSKLIWFLPIAVSFCLSARAAEEAKSSSPLEITNMARIATDLKLDSLKKEKFSTRVKIAVFDNGFWGYEGDLGKLLPADTLCYSNTEIAEQQCKEEYELEMQRARENGEELKASQKPVHGLITAEIISQILARAGYSNYQITMFRVSGLDRLQRAVKKAVDQQFDVVVYADNWEFGGFGDGKGFVNAAIKPALDAKIVWINSGGNFGRNMRTAPVQTTADDWVTFKNDKGKSSDSVSVRCALKTPCDLRLILAWNDFKDDPEEGTDKQLNLYLLDDKKAEIAKSEKIQMLNPPENDKRYSKLPRQMVLAKLEPGDGKKAKIYSIRVKNVSKNFKADVDKLRITASGLGVEILDPSLGETILPPADNPGVIVIGASDDPHGSSSRKLGIPKIYLRSLVELKNGLKPFESSTATAMAGAMAALYIGSGTEKTRDAVEKKLLAVSRPTDFPLPGVKSVASAKEGRGADASASGSKPSSAANSSSAAVKAARPVVRAQSPRYPAPAVAQTRGGVAAPGVLYAQPACLMPVRPVVNDPFLGKLLADFLTLGGAASVNYGGRFGVAVYYDLGAQFGLYRSSPYERYFLTLDGVVLLRPEQFYIIDGTPFVPLFEATAPICP